MMRVCVCVCVQLSEPQCRRHVNRLEDSGGVSLIQILRLEPHSRIRPQFSSLPTNLRLTFFFIANTYTTP
jgi:hypothetical protein